MTEDEEVLAAEQEMAAAEAEIAWEKKKAAVDLAGLIDPTPASDTVGAGMAISDGDYWGAGLSMLSWVPYLGDALAKPIKAARTTKKLIALGEKTAMLKAKISKLRAAKKARDEAKAAKKAEEAARKAKKSASDTKPETCVKCGKGASLPKKDVRCFKRNPKGDTAEFDRQLKGQEEGLNRLSAQEYRDGRKAYDGKRLATANAREQELDRRVSNLVSGGMSKEAANAQAAKEMKTLNALHNPDLIAGGKDITTDFGDAGVNKSIGSQWAVGKPDAKGKPTGRLAELDEIADAAINRGDGAKKMNVKLTRCK